jgi:hypothetical protein
MSLLRSRCVLFFFWIKKPRAVGDFQSGLDRLPSALITNKVMDGDMPCTTRCPEAIRLYLGTEIASSLENGWRAPSALGCHQSVKSSISSGHSVYL